MPVLAAGEATIRSPILKPVVTIGKARFTVLTPDLIRMEWSADASLRTMLRLYF